MGKPYALELEKIPDVYRWAFEVDISDLKMNINSISNTSLVSIGSGGSLTAASLAAFLHQEAGAVAKCITPLEFVSSNWQFKNSCMLFLTAGGRNSDVLNSYKNALELEPRQVVSLCTRLDSPMKKISDEYNYSKFFEFDLPTGKDGFLATNSLVATCTILCRAWQGMGNNNYMLPVTFDTKSYEKSFSEEKSLNRDVWVVLYDWQSLPAAIDLESRFTEAGIASIQLSDYRNFAHGRHNWLAKHGKKTGIISLISPSTYIASKTLKLIPEQIPIIQLETKFVGGVGSLDLIIKSMLLVKRFGEDRNIDPGKPKVPQYGRKLYHLRMNTIPSPPPSIKLTMSERAAIERKIGPIHLQDKHILELWKGKYEEFIYRLKSVKYRAVVFDYDGTLCTPEERFTQPSEKISNKLNELAQSGVIIGIATGRGKSVRKAMQNVIHKKLWEHVIIGYYNCGIIRGLNDNSNSLYSSSLNVKLLEIDQMLHSNSMFEHIATTEPREQQLTIIPNKNADWPVVKRIITSILSKHPECELKFVESSHSLDIITKEVSKLNLIGEIRKQLSFAERNCEILCIGDKGESPGNDHELLSTKYSLSVEDVSIDPNTCWNLAPLGHRGTQATLDYLKRLVVQDSFFTYAENGPVKK